MILVTLIVLGSLVGLLLMRRRALDRATAIKGGAGGSFVGGGVMVALREGHVPVHDPISIAAGVVGAIGFLLVVERLGS